MHLITGKHCLAKCFYLIGYLRFHNYTTVQWYETNGLKKIVLKSEKKRLNNDAHLQDEAGTDPDRVDRVL